MARLLIDTHVLIWTLGDHAKLPGKIKALLEDRKNAVFVSAVTAWEIAIKVGIDKLDFDREFLADFDSSIKQYEWSPLHVIAAHGAHSLHLPNTHKDPFDRLLGAQAQFERMILVSNDIAFERLGVETIW